MSNLAENGMRLVWRDGACGWVHRLEMRAADIDCTHMDDAEFEAFVRAQESAV